MLIPQPGIEPKDFTAVKVSSPNHWTTREFPICFLCACVHAKSLQSCLTICDPMDSNPQGPPVHGILQARILEWVTMPPPRDFPGPGMEPRSSAWQEDPLPLVPPGKPLLSILEINRGTEAQAWHIFLKNYFFHYWVKPCSLSKWLLFWQQSRYTSFLLYMDFFQSLFVFNLSVLFRVSFILKHLV